MRPWGRFAFWARMGAPDRLLVFFEGGAAAGTTGRARGSTFFDDDVDPSDDPSLGSGVLDLDNPNPFRGWSVLFVPSCTGDVYAGDAVRTYRPAGRRSRSTTAATPTPAPPSTGCSGGCPTRAECSWPAAAPAASARSCTPRILRQYPRAQVAQLGDSLGYLFSRPTDLRELWGAGRVLPGWVPGVRAIPRARFTMPRFYRAVAAHYPQASFAQVNFADDAVQRRFHEAAGAAGRVRGGPGGQPGAIRATTPNFRSCLLEGRPTAPCPGRSSTP